MGTSRDNVQFDARLLASVTTYPNDAHPWRRCVETFVHTPDGVRVFACAVPRDPARRPRFRGLTVEASDVR